MPGSVASATPSVGPYKIPTKTENNAPEKRAVPHRAYRRQDELGLCNSPREWDAPISRASSSFSTVVETPQRRIIRSPRCTIDDERIFPLDHTKYQDSETRWHCMSEQAGPHQQDGSVMTITRNLSPQALTKGLTRYAASRVTCLNLWLDHKEDILPEWLDVISNLLVNLQHLTLSQDIFPGEEDVTVSARMRRLYVLYRLPFLTTIDDQPVSREEMRLSRPNDPNGERVERDNWVGTDSLLDNADDDDGYVEPFAMDDDIAPPLEATESIGNQTATELGAEIQELTEKVVALNEIDNDNVSIALTGIELPDIPMNSSGSGEAREDYNSNTTSIGDRDGDNATTSIGDRNTDRNDTTACQTPPAADALEVDLSGAVQSVGPRIRPKIQLDETSFRDDRSPRSLQDQIITSGTYEILSVVSSSHEWTAACGVLSFRTDRTCAPRLKIPFCGGNRQQIEDDSRTGRTCGPRLKIPFCGGNRKQIADDGSFAAREKAKKALREKHMKGKQTSACPPVQRQSSMKSPSDCDHQAKNTSKFFPAPDPEKFFPPTQKSPGEEISANKKLPPSKSLSSPFPMQFRERTKPPKPPPIERVDNSIPETTGQEVARISPRESVSSPMETIAGSLSATRISPPYPPKINVSCAKSPSHAVRSPSKGELPPPCPGARRKVPVSATATTLKSRKARKMARKLKASKENARCTSVFDEESDSDDDSDDESDLDSNINNSSSSSSLSC